MFAKRRCEILRSLPVSISGSVLGGVTLSYNVAAGPSKFLVGTEQVDCCILITKRFHIHLIIVTTQGSVLLATISVTRSGSEAAVCSFRVGISFRAAGVIFLRHPSRGRCVAFWILSMDAFIDSKVTTSFTFLSATHFSMSSC